MHAGRTIWTVAAAAVAMAATVSHVLSEAYAYVYVTIVCLSLVDCLRIIQCCSLCDTGRLDMTWQIHLQSLRS